MALAISAVFGVGTSFFDDDEPVVDREWFDYKIASLRALGAMKTWKNQMPIVDEIVGHRLAQQPQLEHDRWREGHRREWLGPVVAKRDHAQAQHPDVCVWYVPSHRYTDACV